MSSLTAIITGASSGIGQATAIAFAKAGINLALVARSQDKLEKIAENARQQGVTVKIYPFDLSQVELVKEKFTSIAQEWGTIDILVNNAGMGYTNSLQETPLSDWLQVLNLNLTSVLQVIQGVIPKMREQGGGTILNVASIAGMSPFPEWGAYSISKAGVIALSKTLAQEERANQIRVITLSPGAVDTPVWETETVKVELNRSKMLSPETVANTILHAVTLPNSAVIEEITLMPNAGVL